MRYGYNDSAFTALLWILTVEHCFASRLFNLELIDPPQLIARRIPANFQQPFAMGLKVFLSFLLPSISWKGKSRRAEVRHSERPQPVKE